MKKLLLTLVGGVLCCLNLMAADYSNAATKNYAGKTFLDVANTDANGQISGGAPTLVMGAYYALKINKPVWIAHEGGDYVDVNAYSYENATAQGFISPSSTSTDNGYGGLKTTSSRITKFYVTGTTGVAIMAKDATPERPVSFTVSEVASDGALTTVETKTSRGSKSIYVLAGTTELNPSKYYEVDVKGHDKNNSIFYQIRFTKATATNISSIIAKSQVTAAKKWDFSNCKNTAGTEPFDAITDNIKANGTMYWSNGASGDSPSYQYYYQKTLSNKKLSVDGTDATAFAATDGLLFTQTSAGCVGFDLMSGRLRTQNDATTIIIPNLLAGDQINLFGARNGTRNKRGFEFTNCNIPEHKSENASSWTKVPILTVTKSGNVEIACKGGVNITYIEVIPGPGTGAAKLTLADDKEYVYDVDFTGNVTINRTFAADGWYSLCLPFDLDDVSMFSGVAEFNEKVGDTYKFTTVSSIVAGKPYIVKVDATLANPVFEGVTIRKNVAADTSAEFKGALNPTDLAAGCAGIGSGTTVNPLNAGTLKGFRGYFQAASPVKASSFVVDDDVTSTSVVEAAKAVADGKFLINGKMIIMKNGKAYNVAGIEE